MNDIVLRPEQDAAVNSVHNYFQSNNGNPIVAMPCGTGKSHVIARLTAQLRQWYNFRLLMLVDRVELIRQNSERLKQHDANIALGVCSKSYGSRDTQEPIIFGGTQTVIKEVDNLGFRHALFIDECHLLSPNADTSLRKIITGLQKVNPALKVIGFTATDYRLGRGRLSEDEDSIFTDKCFDLTRPEDFIWLINNGRLVPLHNLRTEAQALLENVPVYGGEYSLKHMQYALDDDDLTTNAVRETIKHGEHRKRWLFFCAGIEHAEKVAEKFRAYNIPAAAVHSKMSQDERDRTIAAHRRGELRVLTNNGVLTTGYDDPEIDLICVLRKMKSVGLWVQILGRGMRPFYGQFYTKSHCLVLDFCANTEQLGPVNNPVIPKKRTARKGEMPVKVCEVCGMYNDIQSKVCYNCGTPFPSIEHIKDKPSEADLIDYGDIKPEPIIETFTVKHIYYELVNKPDRPDMLLARYDCEGGRVFPVYVCLDHDENNFAHRKARQWWRQHAKVNTIPVSSRKALEMVPYLHLPKSIKVKIEIGKLAEVLEYHFAGE